MSVISDFQESSKKIGETIKNISYGIIATDFGILTFKIDYFKDKLENIETLIIYSLITSIVAIIFDYFNAVCLFFNSKYKLENKVHENEKGLKIVYFLGYSFFYLKQIVILLAAFLLIYAVSRIL